MDGWGFLAHRWLDTSHLTRAPWGAGNEGVFG